MFQSWRSIWLFFSMNGFLPRIHLIQFLVKSIHKCLDYLLFKVMKHILIRKLNQGKLLNILFVLLVDDGHLQFSSIIFLHQPLNNKHRNPSIYPWKGSFISVSNRLLFKLVLVLFGQIDLFYLNKTSKHRTSQINNFVRLWFIDWISWKKNKLFRNVLFCDISLRWRFCSLVFHWCQSKTNQSNLNEKKHFFLRFYLLSRRKIKISFSGLFLWHYWKKLWSFSFILLVKYRLTYKPTNYFSQDSNFMTTID